MEIVTNRIVWEAIRALKKDGNIRPTLKEIADQIGVMTKQYRSRETIGTHLKGMEREGTIRLGKNRWAGKRLVITLIGETTSLPERNPYDDQGAE